MTTLTLQKYHRKRNFRSTPEPRGTVERARGEPIFVVQRHDASHLHFDFRLEAEGVLKSWAVPKGPSLDPQIKRLAIQTEDHPLDYAQFHGVIPKGEYGGGTVEIWDHGTYTNLTEHKGQSIPLEKGIEHGHILFRLDGKKLQGAFALTRKYIGALRPVKNVLGLDTLHFADEMVSVSDLHFESSMPAVREGEVKMALQLLHSLSGKFDPRQLHDDFREAVLQMIQKKAEGQEISIQPEPEEKAPQVIDLMDALRKSVAEVQRHRKAA